MSIIEKIKAEVERRKNTAETLRERNVCIDILDYLDTLQEQPVCEDAYIKRLHEKRILPTLKGEIKHKFRNEYNTILQTLGLIPLLNPYDVARKRLEEMCLAFAAWGFYNLHLERCEHYPDNPVCGELEEEIKRYYSDEYAYITGNQPTLSIVTNIARHFYELGRQSKEIVDAELVDLVDSYLLEHRCDILLCPRNGLMSFAELVAQWQKEKMEERWLKDRNGCFWDGVNEGKKSMKEQMLQEAVERIVKEDAGGYPYIDATELYDYTEDKPLAKAGDKVRIVIVKED